jgi:hypothetical protein
MPLACVNTTKKEKTMTRIFTTLAFAIALSLGASAQASQDWNFDYYAGAPEEQGEQEDMGQEEGMEQEQMEEGELGDQNAEFDYLAPDAQRRRWTPPRRPTPRRTQMVCYARNVTGQTFSASSWGRGNQRQLQLRAVQNCRRGSFFFVQQTCRPVGCRLIRR